MRKDGKTKSYLEEMDEGGAGYDQDTRRDGLRYFHRVGHTTAETTEKPLIQPPTEQDVEDLMLLDALRASMNITEELDKTQFGHIRERLSTVRKQGLDESAIFENPCEYSTQGEYYNFQNSFLDSFVDDDYDEDEDEYDEEIGEEQYFAEYAGVEAEMEEEWEEEEEEEIFGEYEDEEFYSTDMHRYVESEDKVNIQYK